MVTSNYGSEFWSLPAGEKVGEIFLPFAPGALYYIGPSGDRFAVYDSRGLRDMYIWPTTSTLLGAAKRFGIKELTPDQR